MLPLPAFVDQAQTGATDGLPALQVEALVRASQGKGSRRVTPEEIVASYLARNFRLAFWPAEGDQKGPKEEGWPRQRKTLDDYHTGDRVGIVTGTEVSSGKYLVDVDIDWAPGYQIAAAFLPRTDFIYGRASKRVSHCFYTLPEALACAQYKDPVDGTMLLEVRGTKTDGGLGFQSMAPPSVWSKNGKQEPLEFRSRGEPTHVEVVAAFLRCAALGAVGMLLAKRLGHNGFGHDVRLAWAGHLLRVGIAAEDLVTMGEAISTCCNNIEVIDVRQVVASTVAALAGKVKRVKGGPSLAKLLGSDGKKVVDTVDAWLGRGGDFVRTHEGSILAKNQENIRRAIEALGHELSYNEFADKLLIDGRPLEDPQWIPLLLEIEREHRFSPPIEYFKMVIKDLAWRNSFHPVKQYLDALTWDARPRLDEWLISSADAEDNEYVRAVSSILLIAAVRRVRHPGAKYDELVIWDSPQGTNKSSAAQALCPHPEWFSDDLRLNMYAQQLIEATLGKWIIEASELSGRRKAEVEQLKAMLSRQVDGPARMAYAHFSVERPRHFIIIGTTNSPVYLNDPTGVRRYWPVTIKTFNLKWIATNRDQLWAEAAEREAQGEAIRLKEELWPAAEKEQAKRREIDPWEDVLRPLLLALPEQTDGRRRTTVDALWNSLGIPPERRDRYGALRIAEVMHKLGFGRKTVREGSSVQAGYVTTDPTKLAVHEESREPGEENDGALSKLAAKDDDDDIPF